MRSFRIVNALSLLGAILSMGCGKSSSNDELNVRSFAAEAADIVCSAMVDCSCSDASALQDCKTAYREMITQDLSVQFIRYSSAKLDPAAAQACLDGIRAELSDCSLGTPMMTSVGLASSRGVGINVASCDEMVVGAQAQGDPCGQDWDCAPALSCDQRGYTCAPRAAVEDSCEFVSCQDGLFCLMGSTCAERPGAGEVCPFGNCQDGLSCIAVGGDGPFTCLAPHAVDAVCDDGAGCVDGSYCDGPAWRTWPTARIATRAGSASTAGATSTPAPAKIPESAAP